MVDIDIYGDYVPLDEPVCGYDGELCLEEASKSDRTHSLTAKTRRTELF